MIQSPNYQTSMSMESSLFAGLNHFLYVVIESLLKLNVLIISRNFLRKLKSTNV